MEKLYSVILYANNDRKSGFVKAESLNKALEYCAEEYPNYRVTYINETDEEIL